MRQQFDFNLLCGKIGNKHLKYSSCGKGLRFSRPSRCSASRPAERSTAPERSRNNFGAVNHGFIHKPAYPNADPRDRLPVVVPRPWRRRDAPLYGGKPSARRYAANASFADDGKRCTGDDFANARNSRAGMGLAKW